MDLAGVGTSIIRADIWTGGSGKMMQMQSASLWNNDSNVWFNSVFVYKNHTRMTVKTQLLSFNL